MKYLIKIILLVFLLTGPSLAQNDKLENTFKRLNKNFPGFHIRYRDIDPDSRAVIYMPPLSELNISAQKLIGVAIVVQSDGTIVDARPLSKDAEVLPDFYETIQMAAKFSFSKYLDDCKFSDIPENAKYLAIKHWMLSLSLSNIYTIDKISPRAEYAESLDLLFPEQFSLLSKDIENSDRVDSQKNVVEKFAKKIALQCIRKLSKSDK